MAVLVPRAERLSTGLKTSVRVNVDLTASDLKRIDEASSSIKLEGARLPEFALEMTRR